MSKLKHKSWIILLLAAAGLMIGGVCAPTTASAVVTINNFTGFETEGDEEASAATGTAYRTTFERSGISTIEFNAAADDFQSFELITFQHAEVRETVPFDLAGFTFTEAAGNPTGVDTRCDISGDRLDVNFGAGETK